MIPNEQIRDWIREQETVASHGVGVWAEAARDQLSILRELIEKRAEVERYKAAEAAAERAIDFARGAIRDSIYLEDGLDGSAGEAVLRMLDEWTATRTFDAPTPEQIKALPESASTTLNRAIGEIEKLRAALEKYRAASFQSHTAHWDRTGRGGTGCPECKRAMKLRNEAERILNPPEKVKEP